ncbi:MAG: MBL fold metallo-hydrolase [Denitrovibrio sp.]|nr:MAG: MBL fold metallo-hydrolase [Denitrovibrio sp.]
MNFYQFASGSKGNMYCVTDGKTKLLLEAGVSINNVKKNLGYKLSDFDGCLITHEHKDHSFAAKDLLKMGVDVYMSVGTAEALGLPNNHRLHKIQPLKSFTIGTFKIMPFYIEHDCKEPVGYLIHSTHDGQQLLFVTDTHYLRYTFKNLSIIAIECNYSEDLIDYLDPTRRERLLQTHMSLQTLKKMLDANDLSKVRAIHLLHLSNDNSDEQRFLNEIMNQTAIPTYVHGA